MRLKPALSGPRCPAMHFVDQERPTWKTARKDPWERERPTFSCEKDKREHQMPVIRVEEVP